MNVSKRIDCIKALKMCIVFIKNKFLKIVDH